MVHDGSCSCTGRTAQIIIITLLRWESGTNAQYDDSCWRISKAIKITKIALLGWGKRRGRNKGMENVGVLLEHLVLFKSLCLAGGNGANATM